MPADFPFELKCLRLGPYRVEACLGRGGMGEVYRARDESLDRVVAIKILPERTANDAVAVRVFQAEAAAAAKVQHPNVVTVHLIGQQDGRHFFAMEYVAGESLAQRLARQSRLDLRTALAITGQCLSGLSAAHAQGLVHGDVKPGNILLDSQSDRCVVADFGLARRLTDLTSQRTSGILGTLDYLAPELARGEQADQRADIYSLGTVLYQMLAGRLPFVADTPMAMIFQHAYEPLPPLSQFAHDVPQPVAQIVARMTAKVPAERYADCGAVLRDLAAWESRASRATGAKTGAAALAQSAPRKIRVAATMALGQLHQSAAVRALRARFPHVAGRHFAEGICVLVGLLLVAYVYWPFAERESEQWTGAMQYAPPEAVHRQREIRSSVPKPLERVPKSNAAVPPRPATGASQADGLATSSTSEPMTSAPQPPPPREKERLLPDKPSLPVERELRHGEVSRVRREQHHVNSVNFSPDGTRVATAGNDKTVKIWSVADGELQQSLVGHAHAVLAVAFSPTEPLLASLSKSTEGAMAEPHRPKTVIVWDLASGKPRHTLAISEEVLAEGIRQAYSGLGRSFEDAGESFELAFSRDGTQLATSGECYTARIWDVASGQLVASLGGVRDRVRDVRQHLDEVFSLSFAADGGSLYTGSWDRTVRHWDLSTRLQTRELEFPAKTGVWTVALSPDQKLLAAGGGTMIQLWDTENWQTWRSSRRHTDRVRSLAFSADGLFFASASDDRTGRLYDARTGKSLATLTGHTDRVRSIAFSPDGSLLATASWDGTARLWKVPPAVDPPRRPEIAVLDVSGSTVANEELGRDEAARCVGHSDAVLDVRFLPDGQRVVSASADRTVRVWEAGSGRELRRFTGFAGPVEGLDVSPDGSHLVVCAGDESLALLELESGRAVRWFDGHDERVRAVRFSPDGKKLVSGGDDGCVIVWDVASGRPIRHFARGAPIVSVAYSPGPWSRVAAAASSEKTVLNWETGSSFDEPDDTFTKHGGTVHGCIYYRKNEGKHIFSSADGQPPDTGYAIRMWLTEFDRPETRVFRGHRQAPWGLDCSADGSRLVSGGADRTVRLWEIERGRELYRFDGHAGPVRPVAFSPDARWIASGGADGTVHVWNVPPTDWLQAYNHPPLEAQSLREASVALTFEPEAVVARDGGTLVRDMSDAGNHFTAPGPVPTAAGQVGRAWQSAEIPLDLPRSLLGSKPEFALTAWIRREPQSSPSILYAEQARDGQDVFRIQLGLEGNLEIQSRSGADDSWTSVTTPSGILPAERWCFLAVCSMAEGSGPTEWNVWVDEQKIILSAAMAPRVPAVSTRLGPVDGRIDEFTLFRRALADQEIRWIYQQGLNHEP